MNSVITRVIANPHSKTSWIFYPQDKKPFVISKSKCKGAKLKANHVYIVDFKATTNAKGAIYVYQVHNHGELVIRYPDPAKFLTKKGK